MHYERQAFHLLYAGSWVLLLLAIASFLGLMDLSANQDEATDNMISWVVGEIFHVPDFKTILLAAGAALLFWNTGSTYGAISSRVPHEAFCQVLF